MIKVVFTGGLGNQMFLYAYIYAQIKKNNLEPTIYATMQDNKYEDKRFFALDALNCSINIIKDSKTIKSVKIKGFLQKQFLRVFRRIHIKDENVIKFFKKINICYSPSTFKYYPSLQLNKNFYIKGGSFQSWKYFDEYKSDLIKEFTVTKNISKKNNDILKKINESNSVCLHIRRGDYTNSHYSKTLQICNYEYYKKAMEYIAKNVKNPIFFIFSNSHEDHEWIKKNYKFDYPTINVDFDNQDYEELKLMYCCKHFILSNSSFSWWAQYLAKNKDKIIVAPSKWHLNGVDATDIYMKNWHIVDVKEGQNENINCNQ